MIIHKIFLIALSIVVMCNSSAQEISTLNILEVEQTANTLYQQNQFEEAKAYYDALSIANPDSSEIWSRIWEIDYELSLWGEAIEAGQNIENLGHNLGTSFAYDMAVAHMNLGDQEAALNWLEKALREKFENRTGIYNDDVFSDLRENQRFIALTGYVSQNLDRVAGWRADLDFLVEEARRLHDDPNKSELSSGFQMARDDLYQQIPRLTDQEILMELNKIVALLSDGHSTVYGPTQQSTGDFIQLFLPVKFYDFSDGLFIVNSTEDNMDLIGSRVNRLGSLTPEEAFTNLLTLRGVDNPMTIKWLGSQFYLRDLGPLQAIGASENGQSVSLQIERPDGRSEIINLEGGDSSFPRKLRPPVGNPNNVPLYLQRVNDNYWLEFLPNLDAVYFQFNQVRNNSEDDTLDRFSDELLETLLSNGSKYLIIDVRHNNGGNNSLLTNLINNLVIFENEPDTTVFVITGRNTFSAAQNFINRLERLLKPVFVGEPSSSSPNFVGEETTVILPWSRIAASISNRYWQESSPTDSRQWIAPDIPIKLSSVQYFNNIDPVMDFFENLLGSQR